MYMLWENARTRNQNTACIGKEKEPSWVFWVLRFLWCRRWPKVPWKTWDWPTVHCCMICVPESWREGCYFGSSLFSVYIYIFFFSVEIRILAWFQSSLRLEMLDWKSHFKNLSEITLAKKSFSTLCMQVFCICVSLSALCTWPARVEFRHSCECSTMPAVFLQFSVSACTFQE